MKKNLIAILVSAILFASSGSVIFYYFAEMNMTSLIIVWGVYFACWFVLFFAIAQFLSRQLSKIAKDIDGEVLYRGLANHFNTGGYIFITKDKIVYKSRSFNFQDHITEILIKDISDLKTYNNIGIIPNGLEIIHNGQTDKFIVNDRKEIIEILVKRASKRKLNITERELNMKTYIKIYCIIASIILYIPPIYKQIPRGFIIRPQFPENYCFLHEIFERKMIQIDWSLLIIELLLSAFVLGFICLCLRKD